MTDAVVLSADRALPGVPTPVSYELPAGLAFDEWCEVGRVLRQLHNSVLWWVGDWLVYGRGQWGEMYEQAMEATDYSYDMLRRAHAVSSAFEFGRRRPELSWSHHREVMYLDGPAQDMLLDAALGNDWSVDVLRTKVNEQKAPAAPSLPEHQDGEAESVVAELDGLAEYAEVVDWSQSHIGCVWTQDEHDTLLQLLNKR